jgi:PAP2 superfamily
MNNPTKPAGAEFPSSFLLPQAFPEGSPLHPSYPEGHASVAAACVTILKAWFDESFVLPSPQMVDAQGNALQNDPTSPRLTVGGELNKLVSNIGLARCGAGVHYRDDYLGSLALGEAIAVGILEEQQRTYFEDYFFSLTRFNGETVTIGSRYW